MLTSPKYARKAGIFMKNAYWDSSRLENEKTKTELDMIHL